MRSKLTVAAVAVAAGAAFAPLPGASAACDLNFYAATGYCSPCLLVADKTQRPEPVLCTL